MRNSNLYLFTALVFLSITLTFLSSYLLDIDLLLRNSLANQLSSEEINHILNLKTTWSWIGYTAIPVLLITKISLIAVLLYIGLFFFNTDISYKNLYNILIKSEFIFLLLGIIKLIWLLIFVTKPTLEQLQYFYPLSALNLVGYKSIDPWFIYPLQVLNLFELAYWFLLAYLLSKELNISMDKGFKIVASSYGPALAIWVVAVMFFTLNYS